MQVFIQVDPFPDLGLTQSSWYGILTELVIGDRAMQGLPLAQTEKVTFMDLPIGAVFAYRSSGAIARRNVFKKIMPKSPGGPNAVGILSEKTKFWFEPGAPVLVQKRMTEVA